MISLANAGPVFHGNHILVLHDAQVFRRPDFLNWRYLAVHRTMGSLLARRATIATVSAFSRNELAAMLRLSKTDIPRFKQRRAFRNPQRPIPVGNSSGAWRGQAASACQTHSSPASLASEHIAPCALMVAVSPPLRIVWVFSLVCEPYPHAGRHSQRCHDCAQRRRVNCARDPHPSPGRELNLDRTQPPEGASTIAGRAQWTLPQNGLRHPAAASAPVRKGACARLPPPSHSQIAVNVMWPSNLDNRWPQAPDSPPQSEASRHLSTAVAALDRTEP